MSTAQPPRPQRPNQQAFSLVVTAYLVLGLLAVAGWQNHVPYVFPAVCLLTETLSPWIDNIYSITNPALAVVVAVGVVILGLLFVTMPFLDHLANWIIIDSIRRAERQALRVKVLRDRMEPKPHRKSKNAAR
jgi:hypothetical protein